MEHICGNNQGGNRNRVTNYRPISLLPLPSKLIEKIVHNRLYNYLQQNDLLNVNQHGFRPNHSTIEATSELTDDIYLNMNKSRPTIALFLDFQKAFDTVNHDILISKVKLLGIKGDLLRWFINYVSSRYQQTSANGKASNLRRLECGIPQGSVLGPLLFLIYINDITKNLSHVHTKLYADDTVLYCSQDSFQQAVTGLQNDLSIVVKWCNLNQLSINIMKSKYQIFGSRKMLKYCHDVDLLIDNTPLQRVTTYKYLGILLDTELNFKAHIDNIYKTAAHKTYILSKIRRYITLDTAIKILKTKLLPFLDYGDIFYMAANKAPLSKLDRLFKRALKITFSRALYLQDLNTLCERNNIVSLFKRCSTHLLNFMYKRKDKDIYHTVHNVNTRLHDAITLAVIRPNNSLFSRSVLFRGATAWNMLAPEIRNIGSYHEFKIYTKFSL